MFSPGKSGRMTIPSLLSADRQMIQNEIKRSRKDENAWPRIHYLWPHNPVLEWINDKVVSGFGRHEAPVLTLSDKLGSRRDGLYPLRTHPEQKKPPAGSTLVRRDF